MKMKIKKENHQEKNIKINLEMKKLKRVKINQMKYLKKKKRRKGNKIIIS